MAGGGGRGRLRHGRQSGAGHGDPLPAAGGRHGGRRDHRAEDARGGEARRSRGAAARSLRLSEDGDVLYLVTIDGRQPGYSVGATLQETADLLIGLGAFDALNLDGGGSTTMVRSDGAGDSLVLNRPSGGSERFNGNNFGVFASSLPVPEPATLALLGVGLLGVTALRRSRAA